MKFNIIDYKNTYDELTTKVDELRDEVKNEIRNLITKNSTLIFRTGVIKSINKEHDGTIHFYFNDDGDDYKYNINDASIEMLFAIYDSIKYSSTKKSSNIDRIKGSKKSSISKIPYYNDVKSPNIGGVR